MSLPDYEAKKKAAALFGWEIIGWDTEPTRTSTVLLARGAVFGINEEFCRMPHYDSPAIWLLLLRVEELRKLRAR